MTSHASGAGPQTPDTGRTRGAAPIRVVIADDHAHYRRGLRLVLTIDGDIEVVGEASNGYEALDLALATRPDVLVIDLQMPRLGGIEVVSSLVDLVPETRVLMLTMSEQNADLLGALLAGVDGYVIKDATADEIAAAVRQLHQGEIVVTSAVAADLVSQVLSAGLDAIENPRTAALVDANRPLLRRIARGASVDQIAEEDQVPREAVVGHLRQLLDDARTLSRLGAPQTQGR